MWDCPECGCQAIAASLRVCPQCRAAKEDDMPKATAGGGASNAQDPGTSPAAELPQPPPVSAPKAEHADYATSALGVPPEQAQSMTKPELVELARTAVEGSDQPPPDSSPAPAPAPRPAPRPAPGNTASG